MFDIFNDDHFVPFTDDLKIFNIILNLHDCNVLHSNLDKLYEWREYNKPYLKINIYQTKHYTEKTVTYCFNTLLTE